MVVVVAMVVLIVMNMRSTVNKAMKVEARGLAVRCHGRVGRHEHEMCWSMVITSA